MAERVRTTGLRRWRSRIMLTWSQLGHASPEQSDLVRLARSAPRDQLLRGLTMVATVLLNADNKAGGLSSPAHLAMAHALLKNDLWETANAGFQRRQWQAFLSPEGYLLAIRAVVRFGKPRVAAPAALGDVLGELILTANDLLDPGRSEVDIAGRYFDCGGSPGRTRLATPWRATTAC